MAIGHAGTNGDGEWYRLIVENATGYAIFTTDRQGLVTSWNPGAAAILGYTEGEMLGRNCRVIFTPEDRKAEQLRRELETAETTGRATDERWHVRKGGERFWASGLVMPLREADGRTRGYIMILRDLTDHKRLEDALRQRTVELERADASKNEFLAMLAHELRNPLASVKNAVAVVSRSRAKDDVDWAISVIDRQVGNFARLIDDLLDVSRLAQGKVHLQKQRIDATALVHNAAESVKPLMTERNHDFSVAFNSPTLWVDADPTRLEEILVNILSNSAKYTPIGGRVRLTAGVQAGEVVVRVRDDGIGIPPEMLNRVFDLFTQADGSLARSEGGLGIGLTVVRSLTELHGGTVTAASEGPGKGSEFVVQLPAAEEPATSAPVAEAPADSPAPTRRILVVDDSVDSAAGLVRLLKSSGHEVKAVHCGGDAVEVARSERPEVVLLDIGLPGMNGYEVAAALRREPQGDRAVIIAISGYGDEESRHRSREAGFDHHLTKPLDYDALGAYLERPRRSAPG